MQPQIVHSGVQLSNKQYKVTTPKSVQQGEWTLPWRLIQYAALAGTHKQIH